MAERGRRYAPPSPDGEGKAVCRDDALNSLTIVRESRDVSQPKPARHAFDAARRGDVLADGRGVEDVDAELCANADRGLAWPVFTATRHAVGAGRRRSAPTV